jgi:hypothetical protein
MTVGDEGETNRGARARIAKDGSVIGSGAGAGGGGSPEDFDSDSAAGAGGDIEPRVPRPAGKGAAARKHGSA